MHGPPQSAARGREGICSVKHPTCYWGAHLFLRYFLKRFLSISFHRKVEDLQFRVEEESITKGDLEVKPLQLSRAFMGPHVWKCGRNHLCQPKWPEQAAEEGWQGPRLWPAGLWAWLPEGTGQPLSLGLSHPTSGGPVKFSLLFPCAWKLKTSNWS